jgi:hypothetical protein
MPDRRSPPFSRRATRSTSIPRYRIYLVIHTSDRGERDLLVERQLGDRHAVRAGPHRNEGFASIAPILILIGAPETNWFLSRPLRQPSGGT